MLRELIAGDIANGRSSWPTRAGAGVVHPRVRRPNCVTCCCARSSGGSTRAALAELGRRARPGRLGRPPARCWQQYQDVTVRDRPGAFDPAELIGAAHRGAGERPGPARPRAGAAAAHLRRRVPGHRSGAGPAAALLADGADELVIVGDPDQSIYAFRGADPDAMRRADDMFPASRFAGFAEGQGQLSPIDARADVTIALTTSRRSGAVCSPRPAGSPPRCRRRSPTASSRAAPRTPNRASVDGHRCTLGDRGGGRIADAAAPRPPRRRGRRGRGWR